MVVSLKEEKEELKGETIIELGEVKGKTGGSNIKMQKSRSLVVTKQKRHTKEGWEPKGWREQWDLIREMRRENPAAVDTMGAHCLSDEKKTKNEQAFHTLVGLMLSS